MPLLACFVFVVRPKLLVFRRINFRKQYLYIDMGVKFGPNKLVGPGSFLLQVSVFVL